MTRFNQDGNLLGRLSALAAIVAVVVSVGRICGGDMCPVESAGSCPFLSAKTAGK